MKIGVLTTREAQTVLGISQRRLMALLAEGKLPGSYKLGLQWQIPPAAIQARVRQVSGLRRTQRTSNTQRNHVR